MQKRKQPRVCDGTCINFRRLVMAEIGIMENPQITGLVNLPSRREQLQAEIGFLHSVRNSPWEKSAHIVIRFQANGEAAADILCN